MARDVDTSEYTPDIDRFLKTPLVRRLTGAALREAIHRLFEAAKAPDDGPLPLASAPYRIMVMWRLVRAVARVTGLCGADELLEDATEIEPNPWEVTFRPPSTPVIDSLMRKGRATKLLRLYQAGGLPLLPPRGDLEALTRWCEAAHIISQDLALGRGAMCREALGQLLNEDTCARSDVTPSAVLAFEEMLIIEVFDLLLDKGERAVIKHFRTTYDFSNKEAQGLLRLAKAQASQRSKGTIEDKRALHEARLEDYIARARTDMDTNAEMRALKELAKIQGLLTTAPEDIGADFLRAIQDISKKQDAQFDLDTVAVPVLPSSAPPRALLVPVIESDPDDAEALAEFDAEFDN